MAANITTMGTVVLNGTALPAVSIATDPGIQEMGFRASGQVLITHRIRSTIIPTISFRTPWAAAHTLIGATTLTLSTLKIYMNPFSNYQKSSTAYNWSLRDGAGAIATIQSISEGESGVFFADVMISLLSSDGLTHPLQSNDVEAVTAASSPVLYVRGPVKVNDQLVDGVESIEFSYDHRFFIPQNLNGEVYATKALAYDGSDLTCTIGHASPYSVLTSLGLSGTTRSSATGVYLRKINTDLTIGNTGGAFTLAAGSLTPGQITQGVGSYDRSSFTIRPISTDGATSAWTVSVDTSIPTS